MIKIKVGNIVAHFNRLFNRYKIFPTSLISRKSEVKIWYRKSREEALRWVKQSKIDLESAKWLLKSDPPFSSAVCFQSHQVAEKCFKALLFADWKISDKLLESHDLKVLGGKVKKKTKVPRKTIILQLGKRVMDYYLTTRYPNCQPFDVVPGMAFSENQAMTAIDAASKLVEIVEDYVGVQ